MSRLLLIPEDLYAALAASSSSAANANDGSPVQMIKSRMRRIVGDQTIGADEKAIQYDQQFKRFNKLTREREEQPVNVRLQNFDEISNIAASTNTAATPTTTKANVSKSVKRAPKTTMGSKKRIVLKTNVRRSKNTEQQQQEPQPAEQTSGSSSTTHGDKSPPRTRSKEPTSSSSSAGRELEKNSSLTRQGVMNYIWQNADELKVNREGQILRSGNNQPMVTSNIETIVEYLLGGTERTRFRNPPVGYAEFILRANEHPLLVKYFFPEQYKKQRQQQGKGFSAFNSNKNKHKKAKGMTQFSFKPSLWHQ